MNHPINTAALLGLAAVLFCSVAITTSGHCDNSTYPVLFRLHNPERTPVVIRLVTPGVYVDEVTVHAPVTRVGDPVPLPKETKKPIRKY